MTEKIIPVVHEEYEFTVLMHGTGETPEIAWLNAVKNFATEQGVLSPVLIDVGEVDG